MAKPRLTSSVKRGLRSLAALAEAGACEDVFGLTLEQMETDGRLQEWEEVMDACEWIRSLDIPERRATKGVDRGE